MVQGQLGRIERGRGEFSLRVGRGLGNFEEGRLKNMCSNRIGCLVVGGHFEHRKLVDVLLVVAIGRSAVYELERFQLSF
jgi:hypothetical protein